MISINKNGQKIDLSKIVELNGKKSFTLDGLTLNDLLSINVSKGIKFKSTLVDNDLKIVFTNTDGSPFEVVLKNMATLLAENDGDKLVDIVETNENKVLSSISDLANAVVASAAGSDTPAANNINTSDSAANNAGIVSLLSFQDANLDDEELIDPLSQSIVLEEDFLKRTTENSAPVINTITAVTVNEDASLFSGTITSTDVDANATATYSIASTVAGFTLNENGTYTFDAANAAYQSLSAGQTKVITIPVTVTDDANAKDTQNLVLTVNGTNDAPTVEVIPVSLNEIDFSTLSDYANAYKIITEAEMFDIMGVEDVDLNDNLTLSLVTDTSNFASTTNSGILNSNSGVLQLTEADIAFFELTNVNVGDFFIYSIGFDGLSENEIANVSFNVQVSDGIATTTSTVSLTVNGTNDAPTVEVIPVSLNEIDFSTLSDYANAYKIITEAEMFDIMGVEDVDLNDNLTLSLVTDTSNFASTTNSGILNSNSGVLQLTEADIAFFELTNVNVGDFFIYSIGFDGLSENEIANVSFNVQVSDGIATTTSTVSLTVNGTNDAPTVEVIPVSLNEIDFSTLSDYANAYKIITEAEMFDIMGVEDVDLNDNLTLSLVTDTSNFASTTNSGILNSNSGVLQLTEADIAFFELTNVNVGDFFIYSIGFDGLSENEIANVSFNVQVSDGIATTTSTVSLTVNGTNDAPTVEVIPVSLNEIDFSTLSDYANAYKIITEAEMFDIMGVEDVDLNDNLTLSLVTDTSNFASTTNSGILNSNSGVLQLTEADIAFFELTNVNVGDFFIYSIGFDGLSENEIANVSFNVQVSDGISPVTSTVSLTVTGTNDAPTVEVIPVILNEIDFSTLSDYANAYKIITEAEMFDIMGVEDVDLNDNLTLSLVTDTSNFTSTTNSGILNSNSGVLQLTEADIAFFELTNVNVGDFFIYSIGFDGLSENEIANVSFNVQVSDGIATTTSTVSLNVNGVNDVVSGIIGSELITTMIITPSDTNSNESQINDLISGSVTLSTLTDILNANGEEINLAQSNGSATKLVISAQAGETINFNWIFNDAEENPGDFEGPEDNEPNLIPIAEEDLELYDESSFNDFAFVVVDGEKIDLLAKVSDFGFTNSGTYSITFETAGEHEVIFGVMNDDDNEVDSSLEITYSNNVEVLSVSYPESNGEIIESIIDYIVQEDSSLSFAGNIGTALNSFEGQDEFPVTQQFMFTVDYIDEMTYQFPYVITVNQDGTFSAYAQPLIIEQDEITDFVLQNDINLLAEGMNVSYSFNYEDTNGNNNTYNIIIQGQNDAPQVDQFENGFGFFLPESSIFSGQLIANDPDLEDTLTYSLPDELQVPGLSLNTNGSFTFDISAYEEFSELSFNWIARDENGVSTGIQTFYIYSNEEEGEGEDLEPGITYATSVEVLGDIQADEDGKNSIDYISFTHQGGGVSFDLLSEYSLDINMNDTREEVDTYIYLFNKTGSYDGTSFIASNDDSDYGGADGSTDSLDSYINIENLDAGDYVLVVGSYRLDMSEIQQGFNDESDFGPYKLTISSDIAVSNIEKTTPFTIGEIVNNAPVINTITAVTVNEDASLFSGTITSTDVDANATATYSIASTVAGFTLNENGTYTFDAANAAYQSLSAGQTKVITIPVTVTDDANAKDTQNLVLTVNGTNDAPTVEVIPVSLNEIDFSTLSDYANAYKIITEAEMFDIMGVEDVDLNDNLTLSLVTDTSNFASTTNSGILNSNSGVLQLTEADIAFFELTNVNVGDFFIYSIGFDGLSENEIANVSFNVQVSDGIATTTSTVSLTVNGTNDAPTVEVIPVSLNEIDFSTLSDYANAYKIITEAEMFDIMGVEDVDLNDNLTLSLVTDTSNFASTTNSGILNSNSGVLQLTEADIAFFELTNVNVGDFFIYSIGFDGLSENEIANVSFNVQVSDGISPVTSTVSLTVTGTNDAPTVEVIPVILNEIDFSTLSDYANAYKIITEAEMFDIMGVEDVDLNDNLTLSLVTDTSNFTSTTNSGILNSNSGVLQLTEADIAFFELTNVNVGDFFIYSLGFDGLNTSDVANVTFDVIVSDGITPVTSTVSLNVNGVTDTSGIILTQTLNFVADSLNTAPTASASSNSVLSTSSISYAGQLVANDVDIADTLTYTYDNTSVSMTLSVDGLNNLDTLVALNNASLITALTEVKTFASSFASTGSLAGLLTLSSSTIATGKGTVSTLLNFLNTNSDLKDEILALKDFIAVNQASIIANTSLLASDIVLLQSVLTQSNLTALENLFDSLQTLISNPTVVSSIHAILADNNISATELTALSLNTTVQGLVTQVGSVIAANSTILGLLDIPTIITKLQDVLTVDTVNGEVSATVDLPTTLANAMIALDANTGEYTITHPYLATLPANTQVEVNFDYTVTDSFGASDDSTAAILIASENVDKMSASLTDEGTLVLGEETEIDMSSLLSNITSNINVADIDSIDLSSNEHILSNLTIMDFQEMVSDDSSNTLAIKGENNDIIKLDPAIWLKDTTDTDSNSVVDNADDHFVSYKATGTDAQVLTLLIEETIKVENI